jgi:hypothetical protein
MRSSGGSDAFDDLVRDAARLRVDDQDARHRRYGAGDA